MELTREQYEENSHAGGTKVNEKTGLISDYINAWMTLGTGLLSALDDREGHNELDDEEIDLMFKPIVAYEQYVIEKASKNGFMPWILADSDPKSIKKINRLVENFNANRKALKEEKNFKKAKAYFDSADCLIRGNK